MAHSDFDKALSFFNKTFFGEYTNKTNDGSTEKVDLTVNVDYYDPTNASKTKSKKSYVRTLELLKEDINSNNYLISGANGDNDINPKDVTFSNFDTSNISELIEWSKKYPAMTINPVQIAMLKDFQTYPANRFMIVRRFKGGVDDNIFSPSVINQKPIASIVGYYDLKEKPITISFGEKWAANQTDDFWEVLNDIMGIDLLTISPGMGKIVKAGGKNPYAQDLALKIGQRLGFIGEGVNPYGNANLIYEAAVRDVDPEKFNTGFDTTFNFEFTTTYEYRDLPRADGQKILKSLLQSARMLGTSNAQFLAGDKGVTSAENLFNSIKDGNVSGFVKTVIDTIVDVAQEGLDKLKNVLGGSDGKKEDEKDDSSGDVALSKFKNITKGLADAMGEIMKTRYQRYQWKVIGVMGTISGQHTAPWHLTMGNPKAPWFSMGNLILSDMKITPSGELMYDDFPSTWTVSFNLKNGRSRGGQEIIKIFNPGKAREYTTLDKLSKIINVRVPEGTTINVKGGLTIEPDETETIDKINGTTNNDSASNQVDNNSIQNNEDAGVDIPEVSTATDKESD